MEAHDPEEHLLCGKGLSPVPHISQEAIGVGHHPLLSLLLVFIVLQLCAEVVQLQVFLLQIPSEVTLQLLQTGEEILCTTTTQTQNIIFYCVVQLRDFCCFEIVGLLCKILL